MSIGQFIAILQRLGVHGVEQYEKKLLDNERDQKRLQDLVCEGHVALAFTKYGWQITLREQSPDLEARRDGIYIGIEVKHFRWKPHHDPIEDTARESAGDLFTVIPSLQDTEGEQSWDQMCRLARENAYQFLEGELNVMFFWCSTQAHSFETILTAAHIYDEELEKSSCDPAMKNLSAMMMSGVWGRHGSIILEPIPHANKPLTTDLRQALDDIREPYDSAHGGRLRARSLHHLENAQNGGMGGISRRMVLLLGASTALRGADTTLAQLILAVRAKGKSLENSAVTREGFQSFVARFKLQVSYSDYVVARLLFEATRDAGFWNLHWVITNRPPNSDNIWSQWKTVNAAYPLAPTAIAECDELSALFAFLAGRAGVRSIGLLWPYPNHTVAVWTVGARRVVIPTTQIFLEESDYWGTKKFDPWRQKAIYEYIRRDVPDAFEIPKSLFAFFVRQMDKYAGASDATLQMLRYFRESFFLKGWTPEQAAREALKRRAGRSRSDPAENLAALESFAEDMRSSVPNGIP